jgi:hypothetical protein
MTIPAQSHPLDRLSRSDRRRWRRLDRQAQAALDAQQLRRLQGLAGCRSRVESVSALGDGSPWVRVVEVRIGRWRLVGRVPAGAAAVLEAALGAGPTLLTAAGRYGPYWTLGFGGPPAVVLVDRLTVLPADGGASNAAHGPGLALVG